MKTYILNDTSRARHVGCVAVMASLYRKLAEHEVVGVHRCGRAGFDSRALARCDALICNGEGTIHHRRPLGGALLEVLGRAQDNGKRTLLVNAVFENEPAYYPDVLRRLDLFTVREPLSQSNARLSGGDPLLFPDLCLDESAGGRPSGVFQDKIVVGDAGVVHCFDTGFRQLAGKRLLITGTQGRLGDVLAAMNHYCRRLLGIRLPFVRPLTFADMVSALGSARCYVTGRHHGIYAAACAGIPFVCVRSNSQKVKGLITWSGMPIPVCRTMDQVLAEIENADRNRDMFREFGEWLLKLPRLTKIIVNEAMTGPGQQGG